jgi:hypothetical protein
MVTGVFVGNILDEQQEENLIFVLTGIHVAAQLFV